MQGVRLVDGPTWKTAFTALAAMLLYLPLSGASYGLRGVVLVVASVVLYRVPLILRPVAMVVWLATVLLLNLPNGSIMMLCGLTLTLAAWVGTLRCGQNSDRRLAQGRYFSEAYVLHLTLIGVFVTLTLPDSKAALTGINAENVLVISGETVVTQAYQQEFERLWAGGRPLKTNY